MFKELVGCSVIVTGVVALVACESKVGTNEEAPPVGEHAELVAKKRAWLQDYDRHCEACMVAFDLCQKGAVDVDEQMACQVAMDACIRGGLLGAQEDGGVDDDDDADVDQDEDADVDEEVDAGIVVVAEDAGAVDVDEDAGDLGGVDAGANDDAGVDDDDDRDELVEAVDACLAQARDCLGDDEQAVRQCLGDLKSCVKGALAGSFESTCQLQVRACRNGGGSRDLVQSVERQCRHHLDL